jgi:hypothetical protein
MRKHKLLFISFLFLFHFSYSQEKAGGAEYVFKANITGPILTNLNVSFECIKNKNAFELDLNKYFALGNFDLMAEQMLAPYYKGYGFGLTYKNILLKHNWYIGLKYTYKYKFFFKEKIFLGGHVNETEATWTIASNKKYAQSLCIMFGNLSHWGHFYFNPFIGLGVSYIETKTVNYYTFDRYRRFDYVVPIKRSNTQYFFPEFQIGLKLGYGFRIKRTKN